MQNDWYFSGLYHTQLNYAEWLILYLIVLYSTKPYRMIDTLLDCPVLNWTMQNDWYFIGLYHTQINYAEWLILYLIVLYSTKLYRMIDTLLDCPVLN